MGTKFLRRSEPCALFAACKRRALLLQGQLPGLRVLALRMPGMSYSAALGNYTLMETNASLRKTLGYKHPSLHVQFTNRSREALIFLMPILHQGMLFIVPDLGHLTHLSQT